MLVRPRPPRGIFLLTNGPIMRFASLALLLCAALSAPTFASGLGDGGSLLTLEIDGRRLQGTALEWSPAEVVFLARDGRLAMFHPGEAKNYRKLGDRFRGYTSSEMRGILSQELGKGFEVSSTGHYLVAHPPGQSDQWSQNFEDLYRACGHYFSVRGFRLAEPQFPLIAVVYPDQASFMRQARAEGANINAAVLGFAHTVGEFGVVLMIGGNIEGVTRVISVQIYDHVEAMEYGHAHGLSAGMLAFSFLVLLALYTLNPSGRRK